MINLHATRKLCERLPVDDKGLFSATPSSQWLFTQPTLDINPLCHWHGNIISVQRRHCVLLVHDTTRFPLVLPALVKRDFIELNSLFADAFMNTLLKCGANDWQLNTAQRFLRPLQVDTQCYRSEQGTLNQMKRGVEHLIQFDNLNVAELTGYTLGAWLADSPRSVKGKNFIWPKKALLELLTRLASD